MLPKQTRNTILPGGFFLRLLSGKSLPVGYLGCLVCVVTLETNPAPQAGEHSELLRKAVFNLIKWHEPEFQVRESHALADISKQYNLVAVIFY